MGRKLIVTNTYFQVITAINLTYTEFTNDIVDIVVTDCSNDSEIVSNAISNINLFNNVYNMKSNSYMHIDSIIKRVKRLLYYFFKPVKYYDKVIPLVTYEYDELLFYNYDSFSSYIFNRILKTNKKAKWSRFEEGYVSYFYGGIDSKIVWLKEFVKKTLLMKTMQNYCNYYYFYEPDFVMFNNNEYTINKIKKIDINNFDLVNKLNITFGIDKLDNDYNYKYIFFEESFFCDGQPVDDFDLIMSIVNIVGRENIIIKLHPRNSIDRFAKYGIKTNKAKGVPWEVIQLNNDFSNTIFLTISSGSVLSSRILFKSNNKTFLLFNCLKKRPKLVNSKYIKYINNITQKYGRHGLYVPSDIDNFKLELSKITEQNCNS